MVLELRGYLRCLGPWYFRFGVELWLGKLVLGRGGFVRGIGFFYMFEVKSGS